MPRFTVSKHTGGQEGDHFDLMLEAGESLTTWRLRHTNFENHQKARKIQDHRKKYLDYEGEITGGRGRVKVWDSGVYAVDVWTDKLIQISLSGAQLKLRLRLKREADEEWTTVDAASSVRKTVASHLRNAELDAAPTVELEPLRDSLAREEQKLLSFVRRFSRGEAVDWAEVGFDPEIRDRLQGEWVRWRHPWLDQARSFVDRIDGLIFAIREAGPAVDAEEKGQRPKA